MLARFFSFLPPFFVLFFAYALPFFSRLNVFQPLSEFDVEARERNERIREAARIKMEEDEDEIKRLNEMISQAKIYSVRDAQLQEKEAIQREQEAAERRIAEEMEKDRLRAIEEQEKKQELVRQQRRQGALMVHEQVRPTSTPVQGIKKQTGAESNRCLLEKDKQGYGKSLFFPASLVDVPLPCMPCRQRSNQDTRHKQSSFLIHFCPGRLLDCGA